LRGPAFNISWCDELASFRQVRSIDGEATAWENLRIATRLGTHPQILATTTPKRVPVVREIMKEAKAHKDRVLLRRGKTVDNSYLPKAYLEVLLSLYGGTALGRQELDGEILEAVTGAMTTEGIINANRIARMPENIPWIRLVGLDPSVAEKPNDECGIVVVYVSRTLPILRRHAFVVDDVSMKGSPEKWAAVAVRAAHEHDATIIAEVNQGGGMVKQVLKMAADSQRIPMPQFRETWSSKSKEARAEPVGAAYAQGRVHHLNVFADLESQETSWVLGDAYSPDRQDALIQPCAAGLFPEALIRGLPGSAAVLSVARQHLELPRQVQIPRGGYYGDTRRSG
jgi:phage terminase large subunit-like protein